MPNVPSVYTRLAEYQIRAPTAAPYIDASHQARDHPDHDASYQQQRKRTESHGDHSSPTRLHTRPDLIGAPIGNVNSDAQRRPDRHSIFKREADAD